MTIRRRARDGDGRIIQPMTLANMREHGVRSVDAKCHGCKHEARINVDTWPADAPRARRRAEARLLSLWRQGDRDAAGLARVQSSEGMDDAGEPVRCWPVKCDRC